MKEKTENIHLTHLKLGKLESFEWLYRHYFENVYYYCLSFTKSPADAEEIASDVFVKIWEKRSLIDPTVSLKPLLLKITRDLSWNFLKQKARKKGLREAFLQQASRPSFHDAEIEIMVREYYTILEEAITKLTPQQGKIFSLRFLKGKDLSQIAQELKISKNTVKVHLAKSRRAVLDYLRAHAV